MAKYYTIKTEDVGKLTLTADNGQPINTADCMGPIQACDVGKRVYPIGPNAGSRNPWDNVQVESAEQLNERIYPIDSETACQRIHAARIDAIRHRDEIDSVLTWADLHPDKRKALTKAAKLLEQAHSILNGIA